MNPIAISIYFAFSAIFPFPISSISLFFFGSLGHTTDLKQHTDCPT